MRIYFIITVYLLIQICLTAPPTKNKRHTTTKDKENKQNLDGKLLHDDAKFDHNKAEGSWKKHQKLNVSDPSADQLEKEIRVRGHENEKVNKTQKLNVKEPSIDEAEKELRVRGHEKDKKEAPGKLNVNEPSVDDLEKEIQIPGHENDKKEPKKLNISEPSIDGLEQTIKIQGHERDPKEKKAHNISEPSLDEIEKQLQVQGHENDKKAPEKILNMEPDVGNLDGELLHANPRFDHMKKSTKKQNLTNIEPSNQLLEDIIKIENGSLNEAPKINRSDILPNYEGFHGFLVHGDETFQHDKGNDEGGKGKPADMDDFNKWLQDQGNESKLDRFKRLNNEFESLSKRMEEHDHDFKTKASSSDLKNPREKLKRAIKEIEEEEKKRKIKTDL